MRPYLYLAAAVSFLSQTVHAADVCSSGIYALLAPLKQDAQVKSFCAVKYKPGTSTVTAVISTPGSTNTVTVTSTAVSTDVQIQSVTVTVTSTASVDINTFQKRVATTSSASPSQNAASRTTSTQSSKTTSTTTRSTGNGLLASLSAAAANVVTTACSCFYGGPSTVTVTVNTQGAIVVITATATVSTISTTTSTVTATATTSVDPPDCYCTSVGQYCYQTTPYGRAAGECNYRVQDGPGSQLYCIQASAGCGTCTTDADCSSSIYTSSGYNYCLYSPGTYNSQTKKTGCNVCGGNKDNRCPVPARKLARSLKV